MDKLFAALPAYYRSCGQISEILRVLQEELVQLEAWAQLTAARVTVSTADSQGLALWESDLGLRHRSELPLPARRGLILGALDCGTPGTPEKLTRLFAGLTGGTVECTETPAAASVEFWVTAPGGGADFYSCEQAVRKALPAHLACTFHETMTLTGDMAGGRCLAGALAASLEG